MNLRPYQLTAIQDICQHWRTVNRVLYQAPTGSGKTAVAQVIAEQGMKTLFVVHRKELLEQNEQIFNSNINVTVAMVQTLARRNTSLDYDLIIIDEAHHATSKTYEKLFQTNAKILGLTATPKRLDGKPLGDKFEVLIKGPTIQELIADGYLARPEIYVPQKTAQLVAEHEGDWKVTAGDYNHKSVQQFFADNQKYIFGDVIEHYRQLNPNNLPTIVFCSSVKSAHEMAQLFWDNQITAIPIDGSMNPDIRANQITRFRNREVSCLTSCDLVSEGFDMPDAYAAIMLRPTKSLTVYLQQAGRVLRMKEDKHKCIIIDHVNNTGHFGPPWIQRYWSLEGYGQRTKRDTLTGVNLKLCLKCGNYIASSALICKYCGNPQKSKSKLFKTIYEELQCITIESAQALIEQQCQKILNKEQWKMLKTKEDFVNFATEKGWANPEAWADKKLAEKKANDDIFFNGTRDQLIVMFSKRKDITDPAKKADETLAKRAELQSKRGDSKLVQVFENGTLEEIIEYVKREKPSVTNPEAYAQGVMRKRLAPVFAEGSEEQKQAATTLTGNGPDPNDDKFTQMIKFAKSGKMQNDDGTPKVLSDEEAEKFARNVVRKQVKADLESGDPVKVRAAVEKLHVKNPEAYTQTVLQGR